MGRGEHRAVPRDGFFVRGRSRQARQGVVPSLRGASRSVGNPGLHRGSPLEGADPWKRRQIAPVPAHRGRDQSHDRPGRELPLRSLGEPLDDRSPHGFRHPGRHQKGARGNDRRGAARRREVGRYRHGDILPRGQGDASSDGRPYLHQGAQGIHLAAHLHRGWASPGLRDHGTVHPGGHDNRGYLSLRSFLRRGRFRRRLCLLGDPLDRDPRGHVGVAPHQKAEIGRQAQAFSHGTVPHAFPPLRGLSPLPRRALRTFVGSCVHSHRVPAQSAGARCRGRAHPHGCRCIAERFFSGIPSGGHPVGSRGGGLPFRRPPNPVRSRAGSTLFPTGRPRCSSAYRPSSSSSCSCG